MSYNPHFNYPTHAIPATIPGMSVMQPVMPDTQYGNYSYNPNANSNVSSNVYSNIYGSHSNVSMISQYSTPPGLEIETGHYNRYPDYRYEYPGHIDYQRDYLYQQQKQAEEIKRLQEEAELKQKRIQEELEEDLRQKKIKYNFLTKKYIVEELKKIIFSNTGIIYGNSLIHEIYIDYISKEFLKELEKLYPAQQYNLTNEYIENAFNNPNIIPKYVDRINKYLDYMNIIINVKNVLSLNEHIIHHLKEYFTITNGELQELKNDFTAYEMDNGVDADDSSKKKIMIMSYKFESIYLETPFYLNVVIVDVDLVKSNNETIYYLPYGINDALEQYIMSNGKEYKIAKCIVDEVKEQIRSDPEFCKNILRIKIFTNIRNKITTLMPYSTFDKFKYCLSKSGVLINFYISQDKFSDLYITNKHNRVVECTGCKKDIQIGSNCILHKCCNLPYHTQCMLDCYINSSEKCGDYTCSKCKKTMPDYLGKHTAILMDMLE